jgi:hypothetical protein
MTDDEILEAVVAKTGNPTFRELLDRNGPRYQPGYWQTARRILGLEEPVYPPLAAQVAGVVKAAASTIAAAATGAQVLRSAEDQAACLALCEACDRWEPKDKRCLECACYGALKTRLATQHCPLDKW